MSRELSASFFPSPLEIPGDIVRGGATAGRLLMGAMAPGVVAAAGLAIDQRMARRVWPRMTPYITDYPAADGAPSDVGIITVGGFNNDPEENTLALLPTFSQYGQTALLHDSHTPLDTEANGRVIHEWCDKNKKSTVVLVGLSMAMMINVDTAPALKDSGLDLRLLGDSSPYGYEDVKSESTRKMLKGLSFLHRHGLYGGPVARIALETVGYKIDHPDEKRRWRAGLSHAIGKVRAKGTPSSAHSLSRGDYLVHRDIGPALDMLEGVPIGLMGAGIPENDTIIDFEQSSAKYQARHRGPFYRRTHPELMHSHACNTPGPSNETVMQLMQDFDLISADQRRARIFMPGIPNHAA